MVPSRSATATAGSTWKAFCQPGCRLRRRHRRREYRHQAAPARQRVGDRPARSRLTPPRQQQRRWRIATGSLPSRRERPRTPGGSAVTNRIGVPHRPCLDLGFTSGVALTFRGADEHVVHGHGRTTARRTTSLHQGGRTYRQGLGELRDWQRCADPSSATTCSPTLTAARLARTPPSGQPVGARGEPEEHARCGRR